MALRNITEFFKPNPSEALELAVSDDVISITTVKREEVWNQPNEVKDKKAGCASYCKYTTTDPAEVGQYAANHGIAYAV